MSYRRLNRPMKPEELDSRISKTDWESTPASVKAVVVELAGRVEQLNEQFALLSSQMTPLLEQMSQLEAELSKRKKAKGTGGRGFGQSIRTLRH